MVHGGDYLHVVKKKVDTISFPKKKKKKELSLPK